MIREGYNSSALSFTVWCLSQQLDLFPTEWLFLPFSCLQTEQQSQLQSTLKLRLDGPAWRNAANTSTQSEEVRSCCIMLYWFPPYCLSDAAVTLYKDTSGASLQHALLCIIKPKPTLGILTCSVYSWVMLLACSCALIILQGLLLSVHTSSMCTGLCLTGQCIASMQSIYAGSATSRSASYCGAAQLPSE